jgi:hypothetical protein
LKKFASHFFNTAFGGTGEKEAPYPGTGEKAKMNSFRIDDYLFTEDMPCRRHF